METAHEPFSLTFIWHTGMLVNKLSHYTQPSAS